MSVSERAAALGAVGMTALLDPAVMDDPARAEEARAALAEAHRLSAPGGDRALRFAGALAHAHAVLGFQTTDPAERRRHHRRGVDLLTDALRAAAWTPAPPPPLPRHVPRPPPARRPRRPPRRPGTRP